jgi:hypothetical protein
VPIPTLPLVSILTLSVLLVLITKGWLSVVPRKLLLGLVPELPVRDQEALLEPVLSADGFNQDKFPLASVCKRPVAIVEVAVKLAGKV